MIRALLLLLCVPVLTGDVAVRAQQSPRAVRFQGDSNVLFVNATDVAAWLGLKLEVVRPGQLITFCREADDGICIPIQLTPDNHRGAGTNLSLTAAVVRSSLRAEVREDNGVVTLRPLPQGSDGEVRDIPAYNAAWGPGRGFRQGDTVPDLPFVDLDGNEVRFSQFLGKRYILYCWASW